MCCHSGRPGESPLDDRIGGVDQDATVPGRQVRQRRAQLLPLHGNHHHVRLRGFLPRAGPGAGASWFTNPASDSDRGYY